MIWVDIPTPECFEDDDAHSEAAWKNIRQFKTMAEAVKFLRYHLGDAQVTDDGYVRLTMGEDDPSCAACGGMGFLPNCERCDACEFFESDEAAREHIYGMAMRRHRPALNACTEVPPVANLLIHVEGGVVQDVTGLSGGWSYEVHDFDDDPDDCVDEADYEGTGCGRGDFPAMSQDMG